MNPVQWQQKIAMKVELLGCQFTIKGKESVCPSVVYTASLFNLLLNWSLVITCMGYCHISVHVFRYNDQEWSSLSLHLFVFETFQSPLSGRNGSSVFLIKICTSEWFKNTNEKAALSRLQSYRVSSALVWPDSARRFEQQP